MRKNMQIITIFLFLFFQFACDKKEEIVVSEKQLVLPSLPAKPVTEEKNKKIVLESLPDDFDISMYYGNYKLVEIRDYIGENENPNIKIITAANIRELSDVEHCYIGKNKFVFSVYTHNNPKYELLDIGWEFDILSDFRQSGYLSVLFNIFPEEKVYNKVVCVMQGGVMIELLFDNKIILHKYGYYILYEKVVN